MANTKIPLYCIYQSSWLDYNGIELTLTKQGGRVVFEAPANDETYRLYGNIRIILQYPSLI